jgi:hypothetical protein
MGTDEVAAAFAAWVEAHKKCVECEKRLAEAHRMSKLMGGTPPDELVEECRRLKAQSDRLLAVAQKVVRGAGTK